MAEIKWVHLQVQVNKMLFHLIVDMGIANIAGMKSHKTCQFQLGKRWSKIQISISNQVNMETHLTKCQLEIVEVWVVE